MEVLAARFGRLPIAGVLVTLVALLAMWRDNTARLPVESAWPTIVSAILVAALVTWLFRLLTGNWARAGVAAGLTAVYAFYVPVIVGLIGLPRTAAVAVHLIFVILLFRLFRRLPKERDRLAGIAGKANMLCILFLLIGGVPLAIQQLRAEAIRSGAAGALESLESRASASSPDVWHILFDRYAGEDTLRGTYGYDNRPFLDALRKRGFVIQDAAYSNYQRTGHSVASTMNGSLLNPLVQPMRDAPGDWVPIYRAMRDGAAIRTFYGMGYRTVFAGSWWEPTRFSNTATTSLNFRAMPQLARLAIDRSAIGFWTAGLTVPYLDGRGDQCFRANAKFKALRELAASNERKQVFAHFLVPHPPFVLNADGSCRSLEQAMASSRRDNYVAQVEFANRQAIRLVDAILKGPRPAVIVLHSDEGPWPAPYVGNEHGLGTDPVSVPWTTLPADKLRQKMEILLAVRDPTGKPPRTMPTSPVQIYPAILKDHFGSAKPIPESRHYVFASDAALYKFEEVSARLER